MAYTRRNTTDGVTIMNKDLYDNLQDGIEERGVTPEMFGAVGDGVHDDTEAFEEALKIGLPLICGNKDYYFSRQIDLRNVTSYFHICGSGNTKLLNFSILKNVKTYNSNNGHGDRNNLVENCIIGSWNTYYTHTHSVFEVGEPVMLKNVRVYNANGLFTIINAWFDFMRFENVRLTYNDFIPTRDCITCFGKDSDFSTGNIIYNNGLPSGDFFYFNQFSGSPTSLNPDIALFRVTSKYTNSNHNINFVSCDHIFLIVEKLSNATVTFDSCHFENSGAIRLLENGSKNAGGEYHVAKIVFKSCGFDDSVYQFDPCCIYKDCHFNFYENFKQGPMNESISIERDLSSAIQKGLVTNCRFGVYGNIGTPNSIPTEIPFDTALCSSYNDMSFITKPLQSIVTLAARLVDTSNNKLKFPAGTYKLTNFISVDKDFIIGNAGGVCENKEFELNGNQTFVLSTDYHYSAGYWCHLYVEFPDGTIKKVVFSPALYGWKRINLTAYGIGIFQSFENVENIPDFGDNIAIKIGNIVRFVKGSITSIPSDYPYKYIYMDKDYNILKR